MPLQALESICQPFFKKEDYFDNQLAKHKEKAATKMIIFESSTLIMNKLGYNSPEKFGTKVVETLLKSMPASQLAVSFRDLKKAEELSAHWVEVRQCPKRRLRGQVRWKKLPYVSDHYGLQLCTPDRYFRLLKEKKTL